MLIEQLLVVTFTESHRRVAPARAPDAGKNPVWGPDPEPAGDTVPVVIDDPGASGLKTRFTGSIGRRFSPFTAFAIAC